MSLTSRMRGTVPVDRVIDALIRRGLDIAIDAAYIHNLCNFPAAHDRQLGN